MRAPDACRRRARPQLLDQRRFEVLPARDADPVLGWGAYLALEGQITGGMMIAASIIASRALQPLEGMIEGWRSVVQTRAAYARVIAAVGCVRSARSRGCCCRARRDASPPTGCCYIPPGSKEPIAQRRIVRARAGRVARHRRPVRVRASRRSPRMLVGCLPPTAGNVRLDGTELRNWDRRQFGEFTGYLPQEVELFPGTIKENVCRMRSDLPDEKVYEAAVVAGVHDMICQLPHGYETVLQASGAPLSGGQKQRIALARALFGDPSLIVLDEPNSNLDAAGEQALNETMRRAKEKGVTVVVITQRPALLNCGRPGAGAAGGTRRGFRLARAGPASRRSRRQRRLPKAADSERRGVADASEHEHGRLPTHRDRHNGNGMCPTALRRPTRRRPCHPRGVDRRLRTVGGIGAARRRRGRLRLVRRHRPEQARAAPRRRHHPRAAGQGRRSRRGQPGRSCASTRRRPRPSCAA